MSLFPYNYNKAEKPKGESFWDMEWQGSPIDFHYATGLADKLFRWHSNNDTDSWTESNDGADEDIRKIALGLITMLAEPSFINMLESIGDRTENLLNTILANIKNGYINEHEVKMFKNLNIWQASWDTILKEGQKAKKKMGEKK